MMRNETTKNDETTRWFNRAVEYATKLTRYDGLTLEVVETLISACQIARDTMRPEFDDARAVLERLRDIMKRDQ